ncbi:hypothetical protein CC78DRAFT_29038 [Lojkania enalia]|uniref:Uncharacterized protein n=1 Tax=Lojkania enalia TaxID=147567 RepID=A0A9P4MWK9_9PLEO|nr:hypothetical protein CC78DRAFT_29038 [Didymosphaeria enalia]
MPQRSIKPNPNGQMFCSYCGQGFKRDEHLERHILTHTNIRPFRCRECKLAFKRKDLLRRHYRSIHAPPTDDDNAQNDDDTAPTRAGSVGRIPIACANCAQSKTKCDNQMPCGRCVKKKLTCERRTFRRSSCKDNPKHYAPSKSDAKDSVLESGGRDIREEVDEENETAKPGSPDSMSPGSQEPEINGTDIGHGGTVVPVADMLGHQLGGTMDVGATFQDNLHLSTNMTFPSFIPDLHQPMYQDIDFDMFIEDSTVTPALGTSNNRLLSARSETTFSDSEWSFIQEDLQKLSSRAPIGPIVLADSCSQWPYYQCNLRTGSGPGGISMSTIASLKVLENPGIWSLCAQPPAVQLTDASAAGSPSAVPCDSSTRDRLLAVTQQIWRIAKERVLSSCTVEQHNDGTDAWMDRIILLPPTSVLQYILERYTSLEHQHFHLLPTQEIITSASLLSSEDKLLSGVLTLLIIAQVTRSSAAPEGRALSNGLVEVCRVVVQDAEEAVTPEVLEGSISLLQLLQWSGDEWHMTVLLKLWEQHAKVIKHSILAKNRNRGTTPATERQAPGFGMDTLRTDETESRLLYSWLAVDLELSLFHDVAPKLAVQNIGSGTSSPVPFESRFTSLNALFETFMEGQLSNQGGFTPTSLRLLLHPLQCLSAHLHQCLDTFGSIHSPGKSPNSTLGLASKAFIDELSALLTRWYRLTFSLGANSNLLDPIMQSSLVLYHIMVLNNFVSFPEVERLIRENVTGGSQNHPPRSWMRTTSSDAAAYLLFHCGQALYILRSMPHNTRPLWWAAALYRVSLVLSQTIISNGSNGPCAAFNTATSPSTAYIVLNREYAPGEADQDVALQMFMGRLQGTPVLTGTEGTTILLHMATDGLDYCLGVLDEHLVFDSTAFASGIRIKLGALRARWGDGMQLT